MSVAVAMPPFTVVAAALRKTTERLAAEVVQSSASPPEWSELEWAIARSVAAMQGISALLANNLTWSGPTAWAAFLEEQREQGRERHARIGVLLERIDAAARQRGIECVALKGAALRALDLYRPGERPMGDVDLLVAGRYMQAIAGAMAEIDYVEAFETHRHRVFEPRSKKPPHGYAEHVDNPLKIEIHTAVAEPLPVRKVDITARLMSGRMRRGLNNYPDLVSLLLHLLLHAAGNMRAHALRQIQLHDIALVGSLLYERDWSLLLELRHEDEASWWLYPPLALTARYYPNHIPTEALRAARAACPRILRVVAARQSLTDVSWSNLRIHAFPGIAWSRTPLEALRFARSRVLPSRTALAELEMARQAQPLFDTVPWYGVPHGRRIFRWLFSRPPRAQTMVSVIAALRDARS
ncbi:MAG TPA: nucleotidyltransferase family protein [Gammaproteobacteria bacterium]|nr:nucleotidyltransferase family protein [Gammaproteobacteria bacterium]